MKWHRAHADVSCGSCGSQIEAGWPMLLVSSASLVRCERCAQGQYQTTPPADLAPLVKPKAPEQPVFAAARDLVRDYKLAQAGD